MKNNLIAVSRFLSLVLRHKPETIGSRRGKPIVLTIASQQMHDAGHLFFQSANGVWLTETVPVEFIEFP